CRIGRFLHEDCADGRTDHAALGLAGVRQGVAHEVHPTALPGGLEHLGGGRLDALVAVTDHQLHAAQATTVQAAKELRPEGFSLRGANLQTKHLALALGVDTHSHYHGHAHNAPGLAGLDVGGVDPQIRPVALDLAV